MRTRILRAVLWMGAMALLAIAWFGTRRQAGEGNSAAESGDAPAPRPALALDHTETFPLPDALPRAGTNHLASREDAGAADIQKRLDRIQDLRFQDDGLSFAALLDELAHPAREVREAALQALVHRGDRAAVPRIREMADRLDDPRERTAFLDAVDFLNLPTLGELSGGPPSPSPGASNSPPSHRPP